MRKIFALLGILTISVVLWTTPGHAFSQKESFIEKLETRGIFKAVPYVSGQKLREPAERPEPDRISVLSQGAIEATGGARSTESASLLTEHYKTNPTGWDSNAKDFLEQLFKMAQDSGASDQRSSSTTRQNDYKQDFTQRPEDKPDTLISVDLKTLDARTEEKLLSEVDRLLEDGGHIEYLEDAAAGQVFLLSYNSEDEGGLLKQKFRTADAVAVIENRRYMPQFTANDPQYAAQQNLQLVRYAQAQVIPRSSTYSPVIAILDNGVNIADPEIGSQLWVNTNEIPNNEIDDDNNGYIDDVHGCNFFRHSNSNPAVSNAACTTASLYSSGWNHGTQVAQIAAASVNNGMGIAGVCPFCRIMILDVDDGAGALLSDILKALIYANENGADVINFSYTSPCPFDLSGDFLASYINTLVNTRRIAWVQAAGNYGSRTQSACLASCGSSSYCNSSARNQAYYYVDAKEVPNTIFVASVDLDRSRSSFSNFDDTKKIISIAAPGNGIPVYINGQPGAVSGTSFAAPHVAGAIGYVLGYTKPGFTPLVSLILDTLRNTGTKISTDRDVSGKLLRMDDAVKVLQAEGNIAGTNRIFISRFYSASRRAHFFTGSSLEAAVVRNTLTPQIYSFEGIEYYAFAEKTEQNMPVFRFFNTANQVHFYTISTVERDSLIANYPANRWRYEGIAFYVFPADYTGPGTIVYRFYNTQFRAHFYTTSQLERDVLIANFPANNWSYEGIAWKAPQ